MLRNVGKACKGKHQFLRQKKVKDMYDMIQILNEFKTFIVNISSSLEVRTTSPMSDRW